MPAVLITVPFLLPPSKTNPIPLWPETETEAARLVGKDWQRAERGQEQALLAPPRRPARGAQRHSQVPSLEHNLNVSAVSPHHTGTHADSHGKLSKALRNRAQRLPFYCQQSDLLSRNIKKNTAISVWGAKKKDKGLQRQQEVSLFMNSSETKLRPSAFPSTVFLSAASSAVYTN